MTQSSRLLECMAWAGTGVLWTVFGGMPKAFAIGSGDLPGSAAAATLSFVQISDSHIGFNKEANPDVAGTLREAIAKINAAAVAAGFRRPHRRHHSSLEARGIRHRPADPQERQDRRDALRAGRA